MKEIEVHSFSPGKVSREYVGKFRIVSQTDQEMILEDQTPISTRVEIRINDPEGSLNYDQCPPWVLVRQTRLLPPGPPRMRVGSGHDGDLFGAYFIRVKDDIVLISV